MNKIEQHKKNIPSSYLGNYDKAMGLDGNKASKSAAVKAKCLDCTCWQREEIKKCPSVTCPLYPHRPFKE